jgi:hypothetical protein
VVEGKVESGFGGLPSSFSGLGLEIGCRHEVDEGAFPDWDPRHGKVYVCKFCGEKIFKPSLHTPPVGKKLHISKKERRRRKAKGQM